MKQNRNKNFAPSVEPCTIL